MCDLQWQKRGKPPQSASPARVDLSLVNYVSFASAADKTDNGDFRALLLVRAANLLFGIPRQRLLCVGAEYSRARADLTKRGVRIA